MSQFQVGDRVVRKNSSALNWYDREMPMPEEGTVEAVLSSGKLTVRWDDEKTSTNPGQFLPSQLLSKAEGDAIMSQLEQEYQAVSVPIMDKLKAAGALILEANKLAENNGKDLMEDWELTADLFAAMDEVGWHTSSLGC
jgi:hypothetical protein